MAMRGPEDQIRSGKRAEDALRASDGPYRRLFERNPQPMWVYDLDSLAFLAVNQAAIEEYGYSRHEFLRMTIRDIRPAEDIPALFQNMSRGVARLAKAGTWRQRKKDGTFIDVAITSHELEWALRPARLVLATDVTERKRAEEALRASESNLSAAQAVAHVGNWSWDIINDSVSWLQTDCAGIGS